MIDNLPSWQMNGLDIDEVPIDSPYGYIYKVTYSDNTYYYGKKNFYNILKFPALKSGKQRPNSKRIGKNKDGKRVYFDEVKRESNWKAYTGSNDIDLPISSREVLAFARSNRELTYLEAKCLFQVEALEDEYCRNQNILGSFYRDRLI